MIKVYNTLKKKKQPLKPRKDKKINMFVCGPTVYDFSHVGHARTYIVFDTIAKYLKQKGYDVFYLQNITDIDDKIIKRANQTNTAPKKLARKFEKEYLKDMASLNVISVKKYARATDHIKQIINQVKKLLDKEYAYQIEDGIYYNIKNFKDYGKLSGRTAKQAEDAISRVDQSKQKKNKGDFCLWKKSKPDEPKWPSPWFDGRPGWHIEDTAIAEEYFGSQYDIHGGGRDLIFPHHEAEIAQMEAISNKKPFVKYWLHPGFLTVKGKKMSKSIGNFITIRDFLQKHSPRILRLFVLKSHYRSPIDYNQDSINQVKNDLERIDEFVSKLKSQKSNNSGSKKINQIIKRTKQSFQKAMNDDFNTPLALSSVFKLIGEINKITDESDLTVEQAKKILNLLEEFDEFFSLFIKTKKDKIPADIQKLAQQREKHRKNKQWKKADQVRKEIEKKGYKIKDTSKGPKIKKGQASFAC